MKLNLASGHDKREGWWNVDVAPASQPDQVADVLTLEFWDAIPSDTIEAVAASHFLEHIPHNLFAAGRTDGLIWFMEQVYRVLIPGGEMITVFPHHHSDQAYGDPTHRRLITVDTFKYFNSERRQQIKIEHYDIRTDFDILQDQCRMTVMESIANQGKQVIERAERSTWNSVVEVELHLRAVKPCRT